MDPLMTSDEVAAYLRVDVVTIRRLVSRGELSAYRVGGEYRFARTDLETYLQRQRVTGGEESSADPLDAIVQFASNFLFGKQSQKPFTLREGFDKFTPGARKVLELAQAEAHGFNHNYIGTEHLLLGLLREGEGNGAQALRRLSVNLEEARSKVELIIGRGERVVLGEVGLTPRAKKVIHLAVEEAQRLKQEHIGTEHLLLGLIREGNGIAAGVLESLGVSLDAARTEVIRLLDEQRQQQDEQRQQKEQGVPVPPEAASLVAEGTPSITCAHCGARCPAYFRYCFHCGVPFHS